MPDLPHLEVTFKGGEEGKGKDRRSYHCMEMIQWLLEDPIIVWKWSNGCVGIQSLSGKMIQYLCGYPIIVGKWFNCYVGIQSIVWKWSNGCVGIQSMCGNDPMVVWGSNHCVEMIQWLCGVLIIVKGNQKSKVGTADFRKKGTFSVHSFNKDYLSIPERPGS